MSLFVLFQKHTGITFAILQIVYPFKQTTIINDLKKRERKESQCIKVVKVKVTRNQTKRIRLKLKPRK